MVSHILLDFVSFLGSWLVLLLLVALLPFLFLSGLLLLSGLNKFLQFVQIFCE
jgi:hypothetical protein